MPGTYFSRTLVRWARRGNLRPFPWRRSGSPYELLFTELMLRRTRAESVVPVHREFFSRWPALDDLLTAPASEISEVLYPLGLRWRRDNILAVREELRRTGFPTPTYGSLTSLPGVGDYVASAVLCFGYGQPYPLIDTNLVRLLGRYFGLEVHAETRRRKPFISLAGNLVPEKRFEEYNYATLDLAATICLPIAPLCRSCPLRKTCMSRKFKLDHEHSHP